MRHPTQLRTIALALAVGCGGKTLNESAGPSTAFDAGAERTDAEKTDSSSAGVSDSGGMSDGSDESTGAGPGGAESGEVNSASDAAGRTAATLLGAQDVSPDCIAIDSTNVYWGQWNGESAGGAIMKVSRAGGTPTTLATSTELFPHDIAVDATSVYWTMSTGLPSPVAGAIMKVPVGGGTPVMLASTPSPSAIAVDSSAVYWADLGTENGGAAVMKASLDGATVTTLAKNTFALDIAVDSTSVYWLVAGSQLPGSSVEVGVMKVPVSGGTPTQLAAVPAQPAGATGLAVDSTGVYWASWSPTQDPTPLSGHILRVPLTGGQVVTVATGEGPFSSNIALGATSVYWVTNRGFLMSAPHSGGAPVIVAVDFAANIAVDSTGVYGTTPCSSPYPATWGDGGGSCASAVLWLAL